MVMDHIFAEQPKQSVKRFDASLLIKQPGRTSLQAKCLMWTFAVGMAGFEPAASCSQSRRANQAAPHPAQPTVAYLPTWLPHA